MNRKLVWAAVVVGVLLGIWVLNESERRINEPLGYDKAIENWEEPYLLKEEQLRIEDSLRLDSLEKLESRKNEQLEQLFLSLRQNRTPFLDKRDGEIYDSVKIGAYTWMAENLRYDAPGSYLNPKNPHLLYGRLYDWATVMYLHEVYNEQLGYRVNRQHRGVCPKGWHLPTIEEWRDLEIAFGAEYYVGTDRHKADEIHPFWNGTHGRKMKTTFAWDPADAAAVNNRFNVLPAGQQYEKEAESIGIGYMSCFWTTEEYNNFAAWARSFNATEQGVNRTYVNKGMGCSCRCVKD